MIRRLLARLWAYLRAGLREQDEDAPRWRDRRDD